MCIFKKTYTLTHDETIIFMNLIKLRGVKIAREQKVIYL